MNDGKIDLCLVKNVSRMELVKLIGSYRDGSFLKQKHVLRKKIAEYHRCEQIDVRFPKPTAVCGDGEITETETLHAENCREKIRFLLPKGCALPQCVASEEEDLAPYSDAETAEEPSDCSEAAVTEELPASAEKEKETV
jgi:hypothetical protein